MSSAAADGTYVIDVLPGVYRAYVRSDDFLVGLRMTIAHLASRRWRGSVRSVTAVSQAGRIE